MSTNYLAFATDLAVAAANELQDRRTEAFGVGMKHDNPKDIVTSLDILIGEFITEHIRVAHPTHGIHNEEADEIEGDEYLWVIDPIDGSATFARNIPQYAISIGLLHKGVPQVGVVLDPSTGELFSFAQGQGAFLNNVPISTSARRDLKECFVLFAAGRNEDQREWAGESYKKLLGTVNKTKNFSSSALSLAYIAAGRIEAVVAGTFTTLDIAAAVGLLHEAGGAVLDEFGKPAILSKAPQKIYAANSIEMANTLRELLE